MIHLLRMTLLFCALFLLALLPGQSQAQDKVLTMSTTTSTEASGLLEYLLPKFEEDTGITVRVMAKGTGAALRDGMDGNCDLVFVHDPQREEKFVQEGYGTQRYYIMYNDFVIVGPEDDPAGIEQASSAPDALEMIAQAEEPFVSRGDDSGTHGKEKRLWQATDLELNQDQAPVNSSDWYYSIGQGMGEALQFAEEKQAYVLSDRGTYLKYKYGREQGYDLVVDYEGGEMLRNPYGIIPVNPDKHPHVKYDLAKEFAEWLVSDRGQELIGSYKLHDQQLFYPDAE
ncbi:MAG: substrate-binding domain-containing protein [Desulfohalobiaceae bacterium]